MNMQIYQNISINHIRIDAVTNASVLQIGSAGSIRSWAQLYNTGGFTAPAPQLGSIAEQEVSLIRLPNPI